MGDPRKIKNKYSTPSHPWEKERIEKEKPLMKTYGLVNKKELWKLDSLLKKYKDNAKSLVASKSAQAEKERTQLIEKLKSYGLIHDESMDTILGLHVELLLDRRLQTIVLKKGLARTIKQARQMITHRHITVNDKKISAPGFLVRVADESSISFYHGSEFFKEDHPERAVPEQISKKPEKKEAETQPAKEAPAEQAKAEGEN